MTFRASKTCFALICGFVLSSCGSLSNDPDSIGRLLTTTVSDTVAARTGSQKPAPQDTTAMQKALLAIKASGQAGYLARVPKLGITTVLAAEQRNGPYRTYRATGGQTITLSSGIMTATRGLGVDLMAHALSIPETSLFSSGSFPKEYARAQRYLDGEHELLSAEFLCELERTGTETLTVVDRQVQTTLYEETCQNSRRAFKNRYWVSTGSNKIWQSQQSISNVSGFAILQRIELK